MREDIEFWGEYSHHGISCVNALLILSVIKDRDSRMNLFIISFFSNGFAERFEIVHDSI